MISIHPPRAGWDSNKSQKIFCDLSNFVKSSYFLCRDLMSTVFPASFDTQNAPFFGANITGIL